MKHFCGKGNLGLQPAQSGFSSSLHGGCFSVAVPGSTAGLPVKVKAEQCISRVAWGASELPARLLEPHGSTMLRVTA